MVVVEAGDGRAERLLGAGDKRQEDARQFGEAKGGSWSILDRRVEGCM
jgi:hypothetical protein